MVKKIKNFWKFSKFRFYIKNIICNVEFFFFSKKMYRFVDYTEGEMIFRPKKVRKKRFVGYKYKNRIYLDNPGFEDLEPEVWHYWKEKKYF
jgi:hypothetical protein